MDDKVSNRLAQVAYETHSGVFSVRPDDYFTKEITPWEKLPERSKNHWRKIVDAVFIEMNTMDYGDLNY